MAENEDDISPEEVAEIEAVGEAIMGVLDRINPEPGIAVIALAEMAAEITGSGCADRAQFRAMAENIAAHFLERAEQAWQRRHSSKPN